MNLLTTGPRLPCIEDTSSDAITVRYASLPDGYEVLVGGVCIGHVQPDEDDEGGDNKPLAPWNWSCGFDSADFIDSEGPCMTVGEGVGEIVARWFTKPSVIAVSTDNRIEQALDYLRTAETALLNNDLLMTISQAASAIAGLSRQLEVEREQRDDDTHWTKL